MTSFFRPLAVIASTLFFLAATFSAPQSAHGQLVDPGELKLMYDPDTGDLTVKYLGSTTLDISTLQIITLGDSSVPPANGGPFTMPAGIPGVTPGVGGLNGITAPPIASAFLQTFNNNAGGFNGIHSEISYTALGTLLSFDATPTGSIFSLGRVAPIGWSQSNVDTIFMTAPSLDTGIPQQAYFGKFTYTPVGGSNQLGTVAVPEPSTLGLLAGVAIAPIAALFRKRVRQSKVRCA